MSPFGSPPLPYLGLGSVAALEALADRLPDGLFTTDVEGRITSWNRAAARITGWSRGEALGQTCSILAGDAVRGCACGGGALRCGIAERPRASKTCTVRTRDGVLRLIVKSAVPLLDDGGAPVGTLETFAEVGGSAEPGDPAPSACDPAGTAWSILGASSEVAELRRVVPLVARSAATVLLTGESGSGKAHVAQAIHAASPRAAAPFVRARCTPRGRDLLPRALLEAAASGGTLFLEELADLPSEEQPALLRLVTDGVVERADGGVVPVDVRLVCSTERDLRALVAAGAFRADLYFRISAFPLRVPPLRERAGDVPLLAAAFLARVPRAPGAPPRRFTPAALAALGDWTWPGNVRELENVVAFAALRAGAGDVDLAHLPDELRTADARRDAGPDGLRRTLEACGWNRAAAARRLGISRVTLWKRLKEHGIEAPPDASAKILRARRAPAATGRRTRR